MNKKVMKAWFVCDSVRQGKAKNDVEIMVTSADKVTVKHFVPHGRIHKNGKMVAVLVFRDKQGYWVRFPSDSRYKPFRANKCQLKKYV